MALSPKQQAFVEAYLKTWNATKAAIEAEYSEKTAGSQGFDLLKKPEIQAAIKERLESKAMATDEVLYRLAQQARFDPGPFFVFDDSGEFQGMDLQAVRDAGLSHLIKSISQTRIGGWRIEWADSLAALQLIGKHLGLFKEQVEHSGPGGSHIPIAIVKMNLDEI